MSAFNPEDYLGQDSLRGILYAAVIAFFLEVVFLVALGFNHDWLAHPQKTNDIDRTKFVEAEVFQMPERTHLVDTVKQEKPIRKAAAPKEVPLSKVPGQGKKDESKAPAEPEKNITESGPQLPPNHGPIGVYMPAPVLPDYLKTQDLTTHVVIEFFVNAQGGIVPRLLSSSGNDELDALAIKTVKDWKFRPAEQDHKPIDAKIRLRINFEIH